MNNNLIQNVITEEDGKIIVTADNILAQQINVNDNFLVDSDGLTTTEDLVVNNKLIVNDLDYTSKWVIASNLSTANYQVNLSSWKKEDNAFLAVFFSTASNLTANAHIQLNDDTLMPIYNTDNVPLIGSDVSDKMLFLRFYNNTFYAYTSTRSVNSEIYPVGSIYLSINNTNPNTYFGGTWVAWGSGKVPVGVDLNQAEFNAVEKTGGAKTHFHKSPLTWKEGNPSWFGVSNDFGISSATGTIYGNIHTVGDANQPVNRYNTSTESLLQPYITCYMWKRTA